MIRFVTLTVAASMMTAACNRPQSDPLVVVPDSRPPPANVNDAGGGGSIATADPTGTSPPPASTQKPPEVHRAGGETCDSSPPAPGNADPKTGGECQKDADCKVGKNARCRFQPGGHAIPTNRCEYSMCFTDDDCKAGTVCSCGGSGGVRSSCLPSNCRVDADCKETGFCSPSFGDAPYGGCWTYAGYYCHTNADTCSNDSDCQTNGDTSKTCSYQSSLGHWACVANRQCPVG
jgi:hypothetical protein